MDSTEVEIILDQVKGLWPNWEPTPEQERVWKEGLARFEDVDAVRRAVDECSRGPTFKEPKFHRVKECLASSRTPTAGPRPQDGEPGLTTYWVICVEGPRAGHTEQLTYPRRDLIPAAYEVVRVAEMICQKRADYWGGTWEIRQGKTHFEMLHEQRVLCRAKEGPPSVQPEQPKILKNPAVLPPDPFAPPESVTQPPMAPPRVERPPSLPTDEEIPF